jgi:hypothetical protein
MTQEQINTIIQSIKEQYIKDFGKLDCDAYFMCGFVSAVLENLKVESIKGNYKEGTLESEQDYYKRTFGQ